MIVGEILGRTGRALRTRDRVLSATTRATGTGAVRRRAATRLRPAAPAPGRLPVSEARADVESLVNEMDLLDGS